MTGGPDRDGHNDPAAGRAPSPGGRPTRHYGDWGGTIRGGLHALLLIAAAGSLRLASAHENGTLPWVLRAEVSYSGEPNREAYREELQSRVVQALISGGCFQSVVTEGKADLVLHVTIDRLDVTQEKEFRAPPTGGAGIVVVTGASVTLGGSFRVISASGVELIGPEKFFRTAHAAAVTPLDDPLAKALEEAYQEPVRWIHKHVCRKQDKLKERMLKALEAGSR